MLPSTKPSLHNLLTIEDVCFAFNISRMGFYSRIRKRGRFPSRKIGRRVYFTTAILDSFLSIPG